MSDTCSEVDATPKLKEIDEGTPTDDMPGPPGWRRCHWCPSTHIHVVLQNMWQRARVLTVCGKTHLQEAAFLGTASPTSLRHGVTYPQFCGDVDFIKKSMLYTGLDIPALMDSKMLWQRCGTESRKRIMSDGKLPLFKEFGKILQ